MGFGYFVAVTALDRPLPGQPWAWGGFAAAIIGVLMVLITIALGKGTVLFTFYPPLTASPWFYVGLVLVVAASWVWCVLMIIAMRGWKRANPGQPVPLAMFATVANAVMWLWTTAGVAAELLYQVLPAAFGFVQTIDAGLARTLFSWTLHAIRRLRRPHQYGLWHECHGAQHVLGHRAFSSHLRRIGRDHVFRDRL
jgi:cytochrome c oxidase subunit 1